MRLEVSNVLGFEKSREGREGSITFHKGMLTITFVNCAV